MKDRKRIILFVVLLIVFVFACAACADVKPKTTSATRDIMLVEEDGMENSETNLEVEELHNEDFEMALFSNRSIEGDIFSIGEKLELTFKAEKDCYLTILDFTPSGNIMVLFPNKWMKDSFVKAGQEILIPAKGESFALKLGGPAGTDVVKAIATNQDTQILDPDNQKLMGPFSILEDPKAATRDILLVEEDAVDPAKKPLEWAALSLGVHTKGEIEGQGGFGVSIHEDWVAKMWLDRDNFLTGEAMFVKFASNRPCKVISLINKGVSGKENVLFTEGKTLDLSPSKITIYPGKDDKSKLIATTPVGGDVIQATLSDEKGNKQTVFLSVKVEE